MRSNSQVEVREDTVAVFDALAADLDRALGLDMEVLTVPECWAVLQRCAVLRRRLPAIEHPVLNQIAARSDGAELGGTLRGAVADRLHRRRAPPSTRCWRGGPPRACVIPPMTPR